MEPNQIIALFGLFAILVSASVVFLGKLFHEYKQSFGIEARRAALKEVISLLQAEGDEILFNAPKGRLYPTINNKVIVLMHAREKVQYLLDKTRS